jgi:hypothetical protein
MQKLKLVGFLGCIGFLPYFFEMPNYIKLCKLFFFFFWLGRSKTFKEREKV